MNKVIKRTVLNPWHKTHCGNLVAFGDYEMPLWYSSVKEEHQKVLTAAGAFDTSHMAAIILKGSDSFDLLQLCFTRDLNACVGKGHNPLKNGSCLYGAFLKEDGTCIDDAVVYKINDNQFMVVVNSGMGPVIRSHLNAFTNGKDILITDLSDKIGKIDIQGPKSVEIMQRILKNPEHVLDKMAYFSFKGCFNELQKFSGGVHLKDGTPIMLSRSGYTGEIGFEIFTSLEQMTTVWKMIMGTRKDSQVIPCGLAARDSLRTSALLPLSHQDIGQWIYNNHPWMFALPFNEKSNFTKPFLGDEAILNDNCQEYTMAFAGHDLRKVNPCNSKVLDIKGNAIGKVLTCVTDMAIDRYYGQIYSITSPDKPEDLKIRGLSCGFIKTTYRFKTGQSVVLADEKREIPVTIENDIRPDRTARLPLKNFL